MFVIDPDECNGCRRCEVIECFQRGIINEKFTGGVRFEWGDSDQILNLIEKIACREGIGNLLAEGALRVAHKIGKNAEKYVMHSKGMGISGGDYRSRKGMSFAQAVSTRGADHLRGSALIELFSLSPDFEKEFFGTEKAVERTAYEAKGRIVAWYEDNICALTDALEICKMATFYHHPSLLKTEHLLKLFNATTGINMDIELFRKVGERIMSVERAFIVREGIRRKDDRLPDRMYEEPDSIGEVIDRKKFDEMLDEYYAVRGWDKKRVFRPDKNWKN